jgi:hypothetical protein
VGWRERDWAKWTDAERRRFYGTTRPTSHPPTRSSLKSSGRRHTRRETLAALILIAAAVAYDSGALNHSPQRTFNPVSGPVPTPYLRLPQTSPTPTTPASPSPRYTTMSGPSSVPRGTYMTVTGTLPQGVSGPVIVEGKWESGPWYELASTTASDGGYRVRYTLSRPGVVHVRIALPNGDYAIKTIHVT